MLGGLVVFILSPCVLSQVLNLGISSGSDSLNQGYQPLLPQMHGITGYSPYSAIPISSMPYGAMPVSMSHYGAMPMSVSPYAPIGAPMGSGLATAYQPTAYYAVPLYGSQMAEMPRSEAPMKRFMKGAAEGFVMGGLGMLG